MYRSNSREIKHCPIRSSDTILLSAFSDHRFEPLQENELNKIDIEISIMSPMKKISDWKEIVLGRDGLRIMKTWIFRFIFTAGCLGTRLES